MDFKLYSLCLCKVDTDEEEEKDEWVKQNGRQSCELKEALELNIAPGRVLVVQD